MALLFKPENLAWYLGSRTGINSTKRSVLLSSDSSVQPILMPSGQRKDPDATVPHDVVAYSNFHLGPVRGESWLDVLKIAIERHGGAEGKCIGWEGRDLPGLDYLDIQAAFPEARLVDITRLVSACRAVKDEDEQEILRVVGGISAGVMKAMKSAVAKGCDEIEVSVAGYHAYLALWLEHKQDVRGFGSNEGGQFLDVSVWALFGERIKDYTLAPSDTKPLSGQPCAMFVWLGMKGLKTEEEDTVIYNQEPAEEYTNAEKNFEELSNLALAHLKPGMVLAKVHAIVNDRAAQIGEKIGFRFGHGSGYGNHEWPSIASSFNDVVVNEGMSLTVEPHCFRQTWTFVRSRTVLVHRDHVEILTGKDRGEKRFFISNPVAI